MKQKLLLVAFILFGLGVVMTSCKKDDSERAKKTLPDASSNASLSGGTIGQLVLGAEGNDGYTSDGTSLLSNGWSYYNGETGGVNHTFALQKLNSASALAIVARWAYNGFHEFELHPGWQGATEKGLHMGDSVYKFQAAYGTTNFHPEGAYIDRFDLIIPGASATAVLDFTSATGGLIQVVVTKN